MRYAVDGYAVLGYFLQNETQVESAAIGVSTGSATAYATLNLQGDSLAASTSFGNVYSTLDDLQSNSFATSIGSGDVYSTLDLSGSGGGISTLAAGISLDAYLVSNATATVISTGNVYSTIDLLSDGYLVSTAFGNVYSTMLLSSQANMVPSLTARLTFPSIWVGKLSIIPQHTIYEIRTLT